jgi:cytochrome c
MMGFGVQQSFPEMDALTVSDADDIHAYLIDKSWTAYNAQERKQQGKPRTSRRPSAPRTTQH